MFGIFGLDQNNFEQSKSGNIFVRAGNFLVQLAKDGEEFSKEIPAVAISEINHETQHRQNVAQRASNLISGFVGNGTKALLKPLRATGETLQDAGIHIDNASALVSAIQECAIVELNAEHQTDKTTTKDFIANLEITWQNAQESLSKASDGAINASGSTIHHSVNFITKASKEAQKALDPELTAMNKAVAAALGSNCVGGLEGATNTEPNQSLASSRSMSQATTPTPASPRGR